MGVAQEFGRGPPVGREYSSADADPDAEVARAGEQRFVEACTDLLGKTADVLADGDRRNCDGELVPAQARDQTRRRHHRHQPLGNGAKHEIATGMTEHVVDLLEAVDADNQ